MHRVKFNMHYANSPKIGFDLRVLAFFIATVPSFAWAQQQVSIQVEGAVKPHCGFQDGADTTSQSDGELLFNVNPDDTNWSKQSRKIALSLSCNAPFTLAVRSSQGGLKNTDHDGKGIGGNFSNEIAYQLALNMTTEDAAAPLVLACQSRELAGTDSLCGASSGTNAAIGRGAGVGEVAVTLSGSSGFPIRGRYQDTIVLALAFQ